MNTILIIARKEIHDALRNRWIAASALLLAALALTLALLGTAPGGTIKASELAVTSVSLASLSVYLIPLIALMLSFDALAGELERGTLLLLLSYPVQRWQVLAGKFCGHLTVLAIAIVIGYGCTALLALGDPRTGLEHWLAFAWLLTSSLLLGAVFLALGYLASLVVRERATAAGIAIGLWIALVVLYDLALLGVLLSTEGNLQLGERGFQALLLANPTDAYRLFNLAATPEALTGVQSVGIDTAGRLVPLGVLSAWTIAALLTANWVLKRREL